MSESWEEAAPPNLQYREARFIFIRAQKDHIRKCLKLYVAVDPVDTDLIRELVDEYYRLVTLEAPELAHDKR